MTARKRGSDTPPIRPVRMRIPAALYAEMMTALGRPHSHATERVGILSVAADSASGGELLLIGAAYHDIPDDQYLRDNRVGARIGSEAIRTSLERLLQTSWGAFHVHVHPHAGSPGFSPTDRSEQPRLVDSWRALAPDRPHGMIVLSHDSAAAWVWLPGANQPARPEVIDVVGRPMRRLLHCPPDLVRENAIANDPRFSRQSFLGTDAQNRLARARVAVAGLGGGGSHVVQQLAYAGIGQLRLFDGDIIDVVNLNRTVTARASDVARTTKIAAAKRLVRAVLPRIDVQCHSGPWQERPELLRGVDIVVGCVDTFAGRHELEVECRRFAIPYVDIGMDIYPHRGEPPRMAGQIITSLPDNPCMWCLGYLTHDRLGEEAAHYGGAGERPQVIWANGVLASTAVGIVVDLLTGWAGARGPAIQLSYDGNLGELTPDPRLAYLPSHPCPHFPPSAAGPPRLGAAQP